MAYVRGYRRSDGTYVRPHYRRARPAAARPARPTTVRRRVSTPVTRPYQNQMGLTTRVRGYQRADGTYVRSHHRRISRRVVVAASGGGIALFIFVLLALLGGGGTGTGSTPSQQPTTPASVSGHLPRP
jgi:hypothetical protein